MMLFSLVLLLPAAALATAADGQEPVVLKPQLCSFADEATGFYASWHTNCSGLVTFVLNVHNFPHPQQPLLPDTPAPLVPFGHFWFGIGFRLITTQMALVESWPDGFITVCPARVEQGRAPQRELGAGGGVVLGAKGAFFGDTLAVTFAVDESVLAGCKELVFFSAPTPVGRPYGGVPVTRMACDLARTCNRFSSCAGGGGKQPHRHQRAKRVMPSYNMLGRRAYDFSMGQPLGQMDLIGTGSPYDPLVSGINPNFGAYMRQGIDPMMGSSYQYGGMYGTGTMGMYGAYGDASLYGQNSLYGMGGLSGYGGYGGRGWYGQNALYGNAYGRYPYNYNVGSYSSAYSPYSTMMGGSPFARPYGGYGGISSASAYASPWMTSSAFASPFWGDGGLISPLKEKQAKKLEKK